MERTAIREEHVRQIVETATKNNTLFYDVITYTLAQGVSEEPNVSENSDRRFLRKVDKYTKIHNITFLNTVLLMG
jgi:hypothetical protein